MINLNVPHVPHVPDLVKVLDDLCEFLNRYVAFPVQGAAETVSVWIAHTWCVEVFESTPRLALLSPEKQSGKTRLLECIDLVAYNSIHTASTSSSALFRTIGNGTCTILMDEADSYLGYKTRDKHEDLRSLVNTGHRKSGVVMRTEKTSQGQEPKRWNTYAPIALAGIGDLPDTIMDRSVIIAMKRRASTERVKPFRQKEAEQEAEPIVKQLEEIQRTLFEALQTYHPELPPGIEDRPADVWEPLIMIGDVAGYGWEEAVRDAAVKLNETRKEQEPSLGTKLLSDIRTLFRKDKQEIGTQELVSELNSLIDSPWANLKERQLSDRDLATRLKKYDVSPSKIRIGEKTIRGYRRTDFTDAWDRWCPALTPQEAEHPEHPEQDPTRPF